jgi:ribonuclease R
MIALRDLKDDYYVYDDIHHQLKGQRTGKVFRLGDVVEVKLASVSLDDRRISFSLAN